MSMIAAVDEIDRVAREEARVFNDVMNNPASWTLLSQYPEVRAAMTSGFEARFRTLHDLRSKLVIAGIQEHEQTTPPVIAAR